MNSGALERRLGNLGLTSYEAKAYIALTRRDSSTAAHVSRLSGVPRQRIYDVLATLVEKGLASTRPGRSVKYAATAPEIAIDSLVAQRRQQLSNLETDAVALVEELTPAFEAGRTHTDPLEYVEVLRDRRAINERFGELQDAIKDEILVFTKPPYAKPPQEEDVGVEVARTHNACSVYEFSVFDDPEIADGVRRFIEAGEEARFVPELPLKLVIIDECIVMFGMQDPVAGSADGGDLTIVVVEHPSLAKVLKVAFSAVWNEGLTFDQAKKRVAPRTLKTA